MMLLKNLHLKTIFMILSLILGNDKKHDILIFGVNPKPGISFNLTNNSKS